MRDFQKLEVWRQAHLLTLEVYRATTVFPKSELYGITSQMRRAAVSIGANIAEGAGKYSNAELQRFLRIASGSANELQNHLLLARDLGMLQVSEHESLDRRVQSVKRMLTRFIQHLEGTVVGKAESR